MILRPAASEDGSELTWTAQRCQDVKSYNFPTRIRGINQDEQGNLHPKAAEPGGGGAIRPRQPAFPGGVAAAAVDGIPGASTIRRIVDVPMGTFSRGNMAVISASAEGRRTPSIRELAETDLGKWKSDITSLVVL